MDDRDVEGFLAAHALTGEVLRLPAHTPTVEAAAQVMDITEKRIVKSLPTLFDRRVLAEPAAGGAAAGTAEALLRITPAEIVRATRAETVDAIVEV